MSDVDTRVPPADRVDDPPQPPPATTPWHVRLPYALLGLLFLAMAWFTATQAAVHGRTYDEYLQDDYGMRVYQWYASGGQDRSFLEMADYLYMPEHGSGFELIIAAFQHLTGEQWHTRSMVNGVCGLLGIVLMALCGRELAGAWGAFAAATGLALYPRYTGAMFNNSKDVPMTVAMVLVLWLVLRMMRRWTQDTRRFEVLELMAVGAAIGVAASIRVTALAWAALLGLVAAGYWVRHGRHLRGAALRAELVRQTSAALVIGTNAYLVMSLLWPYLLIHPKTGLLRSVEVMSAYDWVHPILFAGQPVMSTELPWYYAPVWLVVGSPLPVIVLTAVAAVGGVLALARRRRLNEGVLLAAAYAALPIALIIVTHPTLYNSLRQFLYVVPGLILIATVTLIRLVRRAFADRRQALAWGLVAVAVLGQAEVVYASARIYPYEYSYFSPLAGGYTTARHNYESTYYGTCTRAAAVWLGKNYSRYTTQPTFRDEHSWNSLTEVDLPDNFQSVGDGEPIFRITTDPTGPGYTEIHTVMLEGEALCRVSVRD